MMQTDLHNEVLLIDIQYFGTVNYINTLFSFSNIFIEQYESYQKMSFRNRCVVLGGNGPVNLSVPLQMGRNQKRLVKEVKISHDTKWQEQHRRTIESCYNRSPFFAFYRDGVWELLQKKEVYLLDLNLRILEWLQKVLQMEGKVSLTDGYHKEAGTGICDLRNTLVPQKMAIMPKPVRYTQVFEERLGFVPNAGILDLLFCCGPEARNLLRDNKLTF